MTASVSTTMFDLSDKVALVTGGARGLGEAIARALVAHGATTVICDIDAAAAEAVADNMRVIERVLAATGPSGWA